MSGILYKAAIGLGCTASIYLLIALGLIAFSRPANTVSDAAEVMDFADAISSVYDDMPAPRAFAARDGVQLSYRLYEGPETSHRLIVLVHGSGWHGMQFHPIARELAMAGAGTVAVPDLRGHGKNPVRRGDVDHIGQLEEDLADLIDHLAGARDDISVVLGGHSSGGGLTVRFAGGPYGGKADGFLLLAPFLKHDAPTTKPNSGGWARPAIPRIVGLTMLNTIGITALNGLPVIGFAMPRSVLEGPYGDTATLAYSYRLNTSFAPRADYGRDLAAIRVPLLVIAGAEDEAFEATLYESTISAHTGTGEYHVLPGANHIGVVTDDRTASLALDWLARNPPR